MINVAGAEHPAARKAESINKKLEAIEEKAWRDKMALLQREAHREWVKICKKKPHWTKVRFGNGTFVIIGMRNDEDPWKYTGSHKAMRGWVSEERWHGPNYLRYFWFVCEASEGGLEELVRP